MLRARTFAEICALAVLYQESTYVVEYNHAGPIIRGDQDSLRALLCMAEVGAEFVSQLREQRGHG